MIAICIGHSRSGDKGAVSVTGMTEHAFNTRLGNDVAALLTNIGHPVEVITHYEGHCYTAAQKWLGEYLKKQNATLAIELHFNSADNPKAQGYEYLHHEDSHRGRDLATALHSAHRVRFAGNVNRGIKPIAPGGRGFEFLRRTPCPAVICEPFFGSNEVEWTLYNKETGRDRLAEAYAAGIRAFLNQS
jgi:N-acetylmuramoyl-L-alanine amidase